MKFDLIKEGGNNVKIDIIIPEKEAQTAYDSAVRRFAQYVNIDGFRKGKAPKHLVERQLGKGRIKVEAIENLMPSALNEIVKKTEIEFITQPYVSNYDDFEPGKDLKVTLRAETKPDVTLGQYKDLTINVADASVTEEAFNSSLESFLNRHAAEETVTGRAAKENDIAVIDFDGYVKDEKIQGGEGKKYPLNLGNSNFIPGFAESIIGHKTGEEFDIDVTFPENYHDAKLKGQKAVFKIKIHELKEKKIPELTDEFAQKAGQFKTAEDLKDDIRKFLEHQREQANKQNSENAMLKLVVDAAKTEISPGMIERETSSLKEEYQARLAQQGISWEMLLKTQNEADIMNDMKAEALQRIKNSLVIDKIAKIENLKVETKDLENKLGQISMAYGVTPTQLVKQLGQDGTFLRGLTQQALHEKVMDFLMVNNKVVLTEGQAAKPAKAAAPAKAKQETSKPAAAAKKTEKTEAPAKKSAKKATTKKTK